MITAASVALPVYVQVTVTIFAITGTIAGTVLTVIHLGEALEQLRRGGRKVAAKVRRNP